MAATRDGVAAAFSRRGFALPADDGGAVAEKLASLAAGGGGGADGLARKFEAYAMAAGIAPSELTPALVAAFEREAAVAAATAARRPVAVGLSWDDAADALADHTNRPHAPAKTPAPAARRGSAARPSPAPTAATPGSAFASRTRTGDAVAALRPDIALPPPPDGGRDVTVSVTPLGGAPGGRLLTDSLARRAAFVDGRISSFAAAFTAAGGPAPGAAVGAACQTAATVIGRIVTADGGDGTGRPAAGVAAVEGGAADGGGRARLDLSRLAAPWRLFPGQCVAISGTCPSGHTLVADAVAASAPPPAARTAKADLRAAAAATGAAGLRVLVAAGPYATGDGASGAYEGLDAVLDAAAGRGAARGAAGDDGSSARPADALILIGPFVDADAPGAAALDRTFDDVFEGEVVSRLAAFAAAATAAGRAPPPVVLIPSPRDLTAAPAFPTPALPLPASCPANVVALPNPATFSLGPGLVIGVSGHDILKDLSRSEAAGGPPGPPRDRLASLAGALLEQACYYPLYPPAPGSLFDAGAAAAEDGGIGMTVAPDILLLPSDLAPFARVAAAAGPAAAAAAAVGDPPPPPAVAAVAVNPGRAVKSGGGAGTLALLSVAPPAIAPGGEDGGDAPHGVVDRCRVDVVRV